MGVIAVKVCKGLYIRSKYTTEVLFKIRILILCDDGDNRGAARNVPERFTILKIREENSNSENLPLRTSRNVRARCAPYYHKERPYCYYGLLADTE